MVSSTWCMPRKKPLVLQTCSFALLILFCGRHFVNVQSCKLVYFKSGLMNLFTVESVHPDSPKMDL